jgi:hypothetical protein
VRRRAAGPSAATGAVDDGKGFIGGVRYCADVSGSPEDDVVVRQLDTDADDPALAVAEIVAELEGTDAARLQPTYDQLDHVLDHVFSTPPRPEAEIEISFTYEGYRITVEQNGRAEFRKL